MNRQIYTCLIRAFAPALAARVYLRGRSDPLYAQAIQERFGLGAGAQATEVRPVWVHAVSLGETRAAQPLVQALLDRQIPVLLTHMTATGRREGARLFASAIERGELGQMWLPYDLPGACRRFLATVQPACGILIEREVWPNLIHEAKTQGVPMVLASGRLSARSAARGRYAGRVLHDAYAGLDLALAQTGEDADRLRAAGAQAVEVCGNIKFDVALSHHQLARGLAWRAAWRRPVITIASTHEGEEGAFACAAMASAAALRDTLLVVVPRHPERFDEVERQLTATGLRVVRRSAIDPLQPLPADVQVLLGDSMGEMIAYYAASDVAIVAGSFLVEGGQNLIEACAVGTSVIVGPHARNFKQVTNDAIAAGAARRVTDAPAALHMAMGIVAHADVGAAMKQASARYLAQHAGAVQRVVGRLEDYLGRSVASAGNRPSMAAHNVPGESASASASHNVMSSSPPRYP